ncbi:MAG: OmpA family protein [Bryobacteraceae bacterium]
MFQRTIAVATLFSTLAACAFAQGLNTSASKDDWEEINFEFNSAILSDGYPSLLRLAELLKTHPGYHVKVEGYTDVLGSERYNEKLGLARANTVREFLVKYGAQSTEISVSTRGKRDPGYPGQKHAFTKTDVARWMNRRVVLTVTDDQGRTVSAAGGVGEAIRSMETKPANPPCCDEILKRLDKLDDIARMLKDMADQNAGLKQQVDDLKQREAALESKLNGMPPPMTEQQTASTVDKEIQKNANKHFSLLGLNVGEDQNRDITFSGRARYFEPFKEHFAVQAQGEYIYYRDQKEGQFDLGLVDRVGNFQAGLFSSFKHVDLGGYQSGGTLGQGALTLDYIFKLGRIGLFGTKSFMDGAVINNANLVLPNGIVNTNVVLQSYLHVVDQVGVSTSLGLWGRNYMEGNFGYLKSFANADRPGGTLRFIFPVTTHLAFTVEGGLNETLLGRDNMGRAEVGLQLGNFLRPREFKASGAPVPVDVPRVRYEVLTRTIRKGHTPPVADAGPNQIGVPSGTVTLDGSNSYSPDGLPITFQWFQDGGTAVSLSSPTSARTTFASESGQSYIFRLVVKDSLGGQGSARVQVTTRSDAKVQILFFQPNPGTIDAGKASQLSWKVLNADTVSITTIGVVQASGNASVSPTTTTTYQLTARNKTSEDNATATVVVTQPKVELTSCSATPTNIMAGESATLTYQTVNATQVSISGLGSEANSGSVTVTPTATTTYTITAANQFGSNTCNVTVTVTPGQMPRIDKFTGAPLTIVAGQTSTLLWQVENATTVNITSLGTVALVGTQDVQPQQTTTYTLTASNSQGSVTATVTINVQAATKITSFTANPPTSPSPGSPVTLTCLANNATSITIAGAGPVNAAGAVVVNPTVTTTYSCTAVGAGGSTDTASLTVNVTPVTPPPPPPTGPPPIVVIQGGPVIQTVVRDLQVDASQSSSPAGNNPLTYFWTSRNTSAAVANPTSPTPTVHLGELYGDYFFDLTVTDSKGNKTTGTVDIQLIVTRVN